MCVAVLSAVALSSLSAFSYPPATLRSAACAFGSRRSCILRCCAAEEEQELDADDPVYRDELWLYQADLRYGDGSSGGGLGYLAAYNPSVVDRSHTRAVLLLAQPQSDRQFITAFRRRIREAGMSPQQLKHVTGHSFRAGGCTDWAVAGLSAADIKDQGGWLSDCWRIYVRPLARHAFNLAARVVAAQQSLLTSMSQGRRTAV